MIQKHQNPSTVSLLASTIKTKTDTGIHCHEQTKTIIQEHWLRMKLTDQILIGISGFQNSIIISGNREEISNGDQNAGKFLNSNILVTQCGDGIRKYFQILGLQKTPEKLIACL